MNKIKNIVFLILLMVSLESCSDLFAKQKAIKLVQNYTIGKNRINFKNWLEKRMDVDSPSEKVWEAGRIKKGYWVVQVTFTSSLDEKRLLYFVNLQTGKITGADDGMSQATLLEFEKSASEFI